MTDEQFQIVLMHEFKRLLQRIGNGEPMVGVSVDEHDGTVSGYMMTGPNLDRRYRVTAKLIQNGDGSQDPTIQVKRVNPKVGPPC